MYRRRPDLDLLGILGLQRRLVRIGLIALVVNIAGNLILIPLIGFMGAAWMTLVTEMVVFGQSLWLILEHLELRRPPVGRLGRTVLAALVLAGALVVVKVAGAPLAGLVALACVLYPALLFGLRALELDDLRVLVKREKPA